MLEPRPNTLESASVHTLLTLLLIMSWGCVEPPTPQGRTGDDRMPDSDMSLPDIAMPGADMPTDDMTPAPPQVETWTLLIGEGPQDEPLQIANRLSTPLPLLIQDAQGTRFHYSELPSGAVIDNGPLPSFDGQPQYKGKASYDTQNGVLLPENAGTARMTAQITINGVLLKATRDLEIIEADPRFSIPRVVHTPSHHALSFEELLVVTQHPEPPQPLHTWFMRQLPTSPAQLSLVDDTSTTVTLDATIDAAGQPQTREFTLHVTLPNEPTTTFDIAIFFEEQATIQAGDSHYCLTFHEQSEITAPATHVRCHGMNHASQLGRGEETRNRLSPTDVLLPSPASFLHGLSVGGEHNCALDQSNKGYCWGSNLENEAHRHLVSASIDRPTLLPTPTRSYRPGRLEPTSSAHSEAWAQVVSGAEHSCGLSYRGHVYCWGVRSQQSNQEYSPILGFSSLDETIDQDPAFPAILMPETGRDTRFHHLSAGRAHTCALSFEGEVVCWGSNTKMQSVPGDIDSTSRDPQLPTVVEFPKDVQAFTRLWTGPHGTCAQGDDGEVYCWGSNEQDNLVPDTSSPTTPDEPSNFRIHARPRKLLADFLRGDQQDLPIVHELALGQNHSCAILQRNPDEEERTLHCWGQSIGGALGRAAATEQDHKKLPGDGLSVDREPLLIFKDPSPVKIAVNDDSTCILHARTGETACWGIPTQGQLGNNLTAVQPPGAMVVDISGYDNADLASLRLSLGRYHTCLPTPAPDKKLSPTCWGSAMYGQTGRGEQAMLHAYATDDQARISHLSGIAPDSIATHDHISCAIKDGNASCWGKNNNFLISTDGNRQFVNTPSSIGSAEYVRPGHSSTCLWSSQTNRLPKCLGVRKDGGLGNAHKTEWENDWQAGTYDFEASYMGDDTANFDYRVVALDVASRTGCMLRERYAKGSDTPLGQTLWCWGNIEERFGLPHFEPSYTLKSFWSKELASTSEPRFVALEMGHEFMCMLDSSGALHCLGRPPMNANRPPLETLTRLIPMHTFQALRASDDLLCLQPTNSNQLACYGNNRQGQLGLLEADTSIAQHERREPLLANGALPLLDVGLGEIHDFEIGPYHGCAIGKQDSNSSRFDLVSVSCWGLDTHGQASFTQGPSETPSYFTPPMNTDWYARSSR